MPSLPAEIIVVLAPFAQLFSDRVWRHAQVLVVGAILAPGKRTVTQLFAGDGVGVGAPLHQLPSGVEPGHVVGLASQSDSAGVASHAAGAARERPLCSGRTIRWNAAAGGRSRPKAVTGMRCAPPRSTSSTVLA